LFDFRLLEGSIIAHAIASYRLDFGPSLLDFGPSLLDFWS
jgi:hypothetical protein